MKRAGRYQAIRIQARSRLRAAPPTPRAGDGAAVNRPSGNWRSTITAAKPVAVDTNRDPDQLGSPSSPALTDVRGTVASKRKQSRIRGGQAKGQTVPDKGSRASPGSPDTRATTKAGLKLPVRAAPRLWPLVGPATLRSACPAIEAIDFSRLCPPLPATRVSRCCPRETRLARVARLVAEADRRVQQMRCRRPT